ncbi:hypothetical protein GCM10027589_46850 [Actinocorallia lasiicapitis]
MIVSNCGVSTVSVGPNGRHADTRHDHADATMPLDAIAALGASEPPGAIAALDVGEPPGAIAALGAGGSTGAIAVLGAGEPPGDRVELRGVGGFGGAGWAARWRAARSGLWVRAWWLVVGEGLAEMPLAGCRWVDESRGDAMSPHGDLGVPALPLLSG